MNTDELKIIMDALVSLGEAGKSGFIWWLVMKYGLNCAMVISFIVAAVLTVRTVIVKLVNNTHGNQLGMELSQMLNTTNNDCRGWDNEYYRSTTKAEIINKVRDLMEKAK